MLHSLNVCTDIAMDISTQNFRSSAVLFQRQRGDSHKSNTQPEADLLGCRHKIPSGALCLLPSGQALLAGPYRKPPSSLCSTR